MILLKATLIIGVFSITALLLLLLLLGLAKNQAFAQSPMLPPPNINNNDNNGGGFNSSSSPSFSKLFKPRSDIPAAAAELGFLSDNETLFKISYPSSWTKNTNPSGRFTAVKSTPFVAFVAPSSQKTSIVISTNVIGHRLLSDYVGEEINTLKYIPGFKLEQSSSSTVGNNMAQKIVYTSSELKNDGLIAGTLKTMEIMTIRDGVAYHFIYSAKEKDFPTFLPIINKMINSFEFKSFPV
jgi:hypothetical protein